ncbi:hypothetical protein E1301_Tti023877 [Triplophysa tibetana]|uniref:Uncharacterized protein n=1 Tax=Triplophysa tibetana TaxID=1572043 RepID=A0A5A9PIG0_9TELE|nr:hypothetical protein E1301_Tti023877 [Triplophysa tibetana]
MKKWLSVDSPAYKALVDIVMDTRLLKDLEQISFQTHRLKKNIGVISFNEGCASALLGQESLVLNEFGENLHHVLSKNDNNGTCDTINIVPPTPSTNEPKDDVVYSEVTIGSKKQLKNNIVQSAGDVTYAVIRGGKTEPEDACRDLSTSMNKTTRK